MEQRDLLRNLLLTGAVFLAVLVVGPRLMPIPPAPSPTAPPTTTAPLESAKPSDSAVTVPPAAAPPTTPVGAESLLTVVEAPDEQTVIMGAGNGEGPLDPSSPYRMQLTLSNVGASVERALLTDHAAALRRPDRYPLLSPVFRPDGTMIRSLAVEKINLDGADVILHDKKWHAGTVERYRTPQGEEGQSVSFTLEVHKESAPAVRLTQTLRLPKQPIDSGRHDLNSNLVVESVSDRPQRIVVTTRGAVGLPQENPRDDRLIDWGVVSPGGHVVGSRDMNYKVAQNQTQQLFAWSAAEPGKRLSWAASGNTYFTCVVAPVDPEGKTASYVTELTAFDVDSDLLTAQDATVRFTTAAVEVSPGAKVVYPAALYLGEKDGKAFRRVPEYLSRNYYYQIEQGFGWCTFTFLVELMIWLLDGLNLVFRDYGVAIIILVLIVRAILHPITKKGQINMVRMQHKMAELGPKIEEIKKKYANDKARMNQEMMKLDINPAGQLMSCLPMFLQMPIWVALYLSLSNNIRMRHEPFLYGLTWIKDLTAQDALIPFSSSIHVPLFGWELSSFNLVPLLVGVFMFIQQKTQPKPRPNPNMTEQQRQQQEAMQRMLPLMSVMMVLIFYKMPSGLNVYIMFSSLFGWLEQVVIRKHIREQEEAGTLHKPARWAREDFLDRPSRRPEKLSWWQKLQKAAEDAQKSRRMPKGKRR